MNERFSPFHEVPAMSIFAGRFSGRNAIITGGASGLGLAVALWDLNADALSAAADVVGAAHTIALDVADAGHVTTAATFDTSGGRTTF